jgi:uncharacterized protein (DUF2235 family)
MKFSEITTRLTGISCPIFGVQWNPPEADVVVAHRLISYLEDRRVLYNPNTLEVPSHCVESVLDMRRVLTHELGHGKLSIEFDASLRAMRLACRKFLDDVQSDGGRIVDFGFDRGHYASWVFLPALGELRAIFGIHLARIASQHGLDIEEPLAKILPLSAGAEGE